MVITLLFLSVQADQLYWVDHNNSKVYDWNSLSKPESLPYIYLTQNYFYMFNLGSNLKETCKGETGSVARFSKAGDSCDVLGRHEYMSVEKFTEGILVGYYGGTLCSKGVPFKTYFKLYCSEYSTEFALEVHECSVVFSKYTPSGCALAYSRLSLAELLGYSALFILAVVCFLSLLEDEESFCTELKGLFRKNLVFSSNNQYELV